MPVNALADITVIECATFVTGPYAGALLAELGARVIKIESPPDGDPYRYFAADEFYSPNFAHLNRNKESLALDLKSEEGKTICIDLVKEADVFIENFRPGAAERLGLGYDALRGANRRLVYCSISAFGKSGPYADKPGFDTLGQAMSGLLSLLTDPDKPSVMGIALSDYTTGMSACYGILGALLARQKTGHGSKVETSLLQATLSFIGETAAGYLRTGQIPDRAARVKNAHAFAFVASDGLPLAIHCSVPEKFWLAFLEAAGRGDLAADERFKTREARKQNYAALEEALKPTFAARPRAEWLERMEKHDVPAAPLYNIAEVLNDPQVKHLGLLEETSHANAGAWKFVGPPVTYAKLSSDPAKPAPLVGEHTAMIMAELGYDSEEIKELEAQDVVKAAEEKRTRGRQERL
ncbi:MAG TPA: CoA transferase [Candidatus Binatia bacterium]|jgi:crotonobetainyl-CoA:carnitine CoA-transferase CaiB-like acyl-CoA transferase|nr:CoA transferase [Candidatus Binatia bacterium]